MSDSAQTKPDSRDHKERIEEDHDGSSHAALKSLTHAGRAHDASAPPQRRRAERVTRSARRSVLGLSTRRGSISIHP
jgi:hypothetical protein